jgi:hypothetical protein
VCSLVERGLRLQQRVNRLARWRVQPVSARPAYDDAVQRLELRPAAVHKVVVEGGKGGRLDRTCPRERGRRQLGGERNPLGCGKNGHLIDNPLVELPGLRCVADEADRQTDRGREASLGADEGELLPQAHPNVADELRRDPGVVAQLAQPLAAVARRPVEFPKHSRARPAGVVCATIPDSSSEAKMYAAPPSTCSSPIAAASLSSLSMPFCSVTTAVPS